MRMPIISIVNAPLNTHIILSISLLPPVTGTVPYICYETHLFQQELKLESKIQESSAVVPWNMAKK